MSPQFQHCTLPFLVSQKWNLSKRIGIMYSSNFERGFPVAQHTSKFERGCPPFHCYYQFGERTVHLSVRQEGIVLVPLFAAKLRWVAER